MLPYLMHNCQHRHVRFTGTSWGANEQIFISIIGRGEYYRLYAIELLGAFESRLSNLKYIFFYIDSNYYIINNAEGCMPRPMLK